MEENGERGGKLIIKTALFDFIARLQLSISKSGMYTSFRKKQPMLYFYASYNICRFIFKRASKMYLYIYSIPNSNIMFCNLFIFPEKKRNEKSITFFLNIIIIFLVIFPLQKFIMNHVES